MSFDIALSGIQAINEELDQTSHNIANAGTYGYKSTRANFSTLIAGTQPTGTEIGSTTQSIDLAGGTLNTGRALDASIAGRGFFVVKNPASGASEYTRVGIFDTSKDGFLVDASGRKVQGFGIKPPSNILGALGDITIPNGQIPAVASTKLNYTGNLSADWTAPLNAWGTPAAVTPTAPPDPSTFNMSKASVLYDSLGGQHTLTQYFITQAPTTANTVTVQLVLDGTDLANPQTLTFDPTTGQMTSPAAPGTIAPIDLSATVLADGGVLTNAFTIDYTNSTMFAGEATTSTNNADGYASGTFSDVTMAGDGSLIAQYSNGQKQTVGKIALATFPDEGALTSVSDTSWVASVGSGGALVGTPGSGMAGSLTTSSLEQSNVDITSELVGLMTSQRNYQANSKVIQTESTMLQSLMQAI